MLFLLARFNYFVLLNDFLDVCIEISVLSFHLLCKKLLAKIFVYCLLECFSATLTSQTTFLFVLRELDSSVVKCLVHQFSVDSK
jgi:hypothetical protein